MLQYDRSIGESLWSTGVRDRDQNFELRSGAHRAKGSDAKQGLHSPPSYESIARRTREVKEGNFAESQPLEGLEPPTC